jgi:hypothetical protein
MCAVSIWHADRFLIEIETIVAEEGEIPSHDQSRRANTRVAVV